nr:Chain C, Diabetes epitope LWMRLLPLL [Homo sapiens]
LWMRLLPLL